MHQPPHKYDSSTPVLTSLIICLRNSRAAMEDFFQRIDLPALTALNVQMIFVDIDSHDGTPELAEAFQSGATFPVEIIYEAQPGLSRARNHALETATGRVVGFFDDPSEFSMEMVRAAIEAFADDDSSYALLGSQPNERLAAGQFISAQLCSGSVLFIRRDLTETLKGFDNSYLTDSNFCGDSLDYALRASLAGKLGRVVRVFDHRHQSSRVAVSEAEIASAGAVYLRHVRYRSPGITRHWLRALRQQSTRERLAEAKGALRSVWHSERFQHRVRRPIFRFRHTRHFQAYGIGTSKSGTHTLRSLTIGNFWSAHEPEDRDLIEQIIAYEKGGVSYSRMMDYLIRRDQRLYLEMDASNLNIHLVELLLGLFPKARFILTIRDCLSWVDSEINHRLSHPFPRAWKQMWDHRYQADQFTTHAPEEQFLANFDLHTLDGYFSYWNWHNSLALSRIPADQLLLIKLKDLSSATEQIADFLGTPVNKLDTRFHHSFAGTKKFGIMREIDPKFLYAKAQQHCGELMKRVFPEISLQSNPGVVA